MGAIGRWMFGMFRPPRRTSGAGRWQVVRVPEAAYMPDAVSEDRGLKELFSTWPAATVETLVPELIARRGRPQRVVALAQELPLPDLGEPSRFCDIALRCEFADGSSVILVLVEHWSAARRVDLRRVLWYVAALLLRHRDSEVLPLVLVTDPSAGAVPDRLVSAPLGELVLELRVQVVRLGPADLPRLRALQNEVAALLTALACADAVEAVLEALLALRAAGVGVDDLRRFVPLAMRLARLPPERIQDLQRRLHEEPAMINVLDELWNEAQTKGMQQGLQQGLQQGRMESARATLASIQRLVARGVVSVPVARAEIEELIAAGAVPEDLGRDALQRLG